MQIYPILFNSIIFYCIGKADVGEPVYFVLVFHEYLFRLYPCLVFLFCFFFANSNCTVVYTFVCVIPACVPSTG